MHQGKLNYLSKVEHHYYYRTKKTEYFLSPEFLGFKTSKWLLSTNNEFVAPNEITIDELAQGYERNPDLERLFEFKQAVILTEEQKKQIQLNEFEKEGYDLAKIKELIEKDKNKKLPGGSSTGNGGENGGKYEPSTAPIRTINTLTELLEARKEQIDREKEKISKEVTIKVKVELSDEQLQDEIEKRVKEERDNLNKKKELVTVLNNSVKYSYDWFKAYLQLLTTYGEKQDTQKQKSISFQEIKPYKADNKYFLLCSASSYISPEIENAEDFKISLVFVSGKTENITVEGVSKKGQDLLIYIPSGLTLDSNKIFKVEINFTPVIDLLDRLYNAFENSKNIDEWENIEEAMPSLN